MIPPLPNPSAGSANPSASLPALWGYTKPALDYLIRSPTNDCSKAPQIDVGYHMGIHTAIYNYIAGAPHRVFAVSEPTFSNTTTSGADLYEQLDKYFAETARELAMGAPQDDSTLIHYIIPSFNRYSLGAHSINRLLNYVNRHYIKRAVDEGGGWLRFTDVLEYFAKTLTADNTRAEIASKLTEMREDELKKWGYLDGGSPQLRAEAETCAEAASPPDRIVFLYSLALRRFRTEFVEPLLAVPKIGKVKNKDAPSKGRLARSVKLFMDSTGTERAKLTELAHILQSVGVPAHHPLRKRLDKWVAT